MKKIFLFTIIIFVISRVYLFASNDISIDLKSVKETNTPSPKPSIDSGKSNDINLFLNSLDRIWGTSNENPKEIYLSKSIEETDKTVIYNFDLNKILDKYLYTPIKFKTSKQTEVIMSISKSDNCPFSDSCSEGDKFLLTLTYNNTTDFIPIKKIINVGFLMSGSKTITIDDEQYTFKIYGSIANPNKSKIEVKGPSGVVLSKELGEILNVFSNFGYKAVLNKEYRIVYGRKIFCDNENYKFLKGKKVFIFEYPVNQNSDYFGIDETSYNGKEFYFESIGKNYKFKLLNGILTISKN